jgi:hypothetical protein
VGVLYHDYVRPGETLYRNTGAAHFTIKAQINHTGRDNTNVLGDAVLPVASFVVIPSAVVAKEVVKTGAAALEAVCDLVTGGKKDEYFSEMSSATYLVCRLQASTGDPRWRPPEVLPPRHEEGDNI